MTTPSVKTKEMESVIDKITPNSQGRVGAILADVCTWCGKPAIEFRNPISRREYSISGFCQKCQDDTFGKD